MKGRSGVDRILAGHGVRHHEDLGRLQFGLDGPKLLHQRLVHVQAAGGVQDDWVQHAGLGMAQRLAAHGDG